MTHAQSQIIDELKKGLQAAQELYKRLWKAREVFYYDITKRNPAFRIFLQGWLNRLNSFPKEI
jgi:hypothetical protein